MKEPWDGKIQLSYSIYCYGCNAFDTIQDTNRRRFMNHIVNHGWVKVAGKWHCEDCATFQSRLKNAVESEFVDPYGKPLKRRFGLSAFKQGFESAYFNEPDENCPYFDHRTTNGSVTFSRAYRRKWFAGRKAYFELMI